MNRKYCLFGGCGLFCALFGVLLAACQTTKIAESQPVDSLSFIDANAGKVYAQAGSGQLAAIDAMTGSVIWVFEDKNLGVFTRAAFVPDALFVAAIDSNSESELLRLNLATGKLDWRVSFEGLGGNGSPVLCGKQVLVSDYWHKTVFAFDGSSGRKHWGTESLPFLFLFPPAVSGNTAYFAAAEKKSPEATQEVLPLSCEDGRPGDGLSFQIDGVSRTPVLLYKDSLVLSGFEQARGTALKAIRIRDGTQLWSALVPDEITRFTPLIQNNVLVAGATSLWALDLNTGRVIFHEPLPTSSVPVAVADGLVFLNSGNQTVEARELPSGKVKWKTKLRGTIDSNIAVLGDHIYVRTDDAGLATLKTTGEVEKYVPIRPPATSAAQY